ncbi:hypothetical protein J3R30DRAFT_3449149 [Lentinula aciculospora]|uniref:Uncharacterized protein n=1 Tax=Lentinula aciculospora TaxID=153920 RepID=A0A9W9AIF4_9AGAR|nr:hypothetical protein J3R30DRAFT_3449149 [Lentinula aciculospora]
MIGMFALSRFVSWLPEFKLFLTAFNFLSATTTTDSNIIILATYTHFHLVRIGSLPGFLWSCTQNTPLFDQPIIPPTRNIQEINTSPNAKLIKKCPR